MALATRRATFSSLGACLSGEYHAKPMTFCCYEALQLVNSRMAAPPRKQASSAWDYVTQGFSHE